MRKTSRVTIKDIAREAGVSAMTVSAVLHGTGQNVKVGSETALRIQRLASAMRYEVNDLARSLRTGRTRALGLVFEHFSPRHDRNPYMGRLFDAVITTAFEADYAMAFCPRLLQRSDSGSISDKRFDGILWCRPCLTPETIEGLENADIPVVVLHAPPWALRGVPTFCADNKAAETQVVQHLAELGHEKIAFVLDVPYSMTVEGRDRTSAFESAIQDAGLQGEVFIWDEEATEIRTLLAEAKYTAVVAYNDFYAAKILALCANAGVNVPRDLSVVGFDSSPFCETTVPRLTSVFQPVEAMAASATTHLIQMIEMGADAPEHIRLYDCRLDVRESTAHRCARSIRN